MDEDQERPPRADAFAVSSDAGVTLFEVERLRRPQNAAARKAELAAARKQQKQQQKQQRQQHQNLFWQLSQSIKSSLTNGQPTSSYLMNCQLHAIH